MGSVSVGGIEIFHRIFGPLTFRAVFSDSPHPYRFDGGADECKIHCLKKMEEILQRQAGEVAAIVVEPLVQGAAGILVHPEGFLKGVRRLADRYEVLLIVDEVATGFGRTGTLFACEQEGVSPDLMCLAKGITGGYLPLAATLASEKVFEAFLKEPWSRTTFYHGHTYTGNALGCAAALASLEVFEQEKTLKKLDRKIAVLEKHLKKIGELDYVGDCRHKGMMAGIELVADKKMKTSFEPTFRIGSQLCHAWRKRGVLLRPLGDVIVIMPPLAIQVDQLQELLEIVDEGIQRELPKLIQA